MYEPLHELFHRLWTKAVGTPDYIKKEWLELCAIVERLDSENARLLRGDFTPEEIHGFCHKIPETVSAEAFANGCAEYQRRLYGCAPHADAHARLAAFVSKHTDELNRRYESLRKRVIGLRVFEKPNSEQRLFEDLNCEEIRQMQRDISEGTL